MDTLPGRRELDEYTFLANANRLIEIDDMQGLVNGRLLIEGEAGIDLGRDFTGYDVENLLAKFDQEAIKGGIDLLAYS